MQTISCIAATNAGISCNLHIYPMIESNTEKCRHHRLNGIIKAIYTKNMSTIQTKWLENSLYMCEESVIDRNRVNGYYKFHRQFYATKKCINWFICLKICCQSRPLIRFWSSLKDQFLLWDFSTNPLNDIDVSVYVHPI